MNKEDLHKIFSDECFNSGSIITTLPVFSIDWIKKTFLDINPIYERRKKIIEKLLKDNE